MYLRRVCQPTMFQILDPSNSLLLNKLQHNILIMLQLLIISWFDNAVTTSDCLIMLQLLLISWFDNVATTSDLIMLQLLVIV